VSTLPKQIADKFLAKLEESKSLDAEKIDQLRALLNGGKKNSCCEANIWRRRTGS